MIQITIVCDKQNATFDYTNPDGVVINQQYKCKTILDSALSQRQLYYYFF